jgi:hypothetical protein
MVTSRAATGPPSFVNYRARRLDHEAAPDARYCGRLSEIAQFRSTCRISRSRQWLVREAPLYRVGHNNRTAHHATTHRRPRYPHPGSRSNHRCARTGFQFKSELGNSDTIESSAELAQPLARSQCPARPNTFPLGRTFAGTGHRWTALATAALGARRGARRAAFRFRIVTSPFRFPSSVGPPTGTLRLHPVVEHRHVMTVTKRPFRVLGGEPAHSGGRPFAI